MGKRNIGHFLGATENGQKTSRTTSPRNIEETSTFESLSGKKSVSWDGHQGPFAQRPRKLVAWGWNSIEKRPFPAKGSLTPKISAIFWEPAKMVKKRAEQLRHETSKKRPLLSLRAAKKSVSWTIRDPSHSALKKWSPGDGILRKKVSSGQMHSDIQNIAPFLGATENGQ